MSNVKEIMEKYPEYQDALFRRGYLITTNNQIDRSEYPFYNKWKVYEIDKYKIYVHEDQEFYRYENEEINVIMIGHAYNPFNMKYKEKELLEDAYNAYRKSKKELFETISEFTGIHIVIIFDKDKIVCVQDCGGMKSCYFGVIENNIYITSHTQLVADICDLEMDEFVRKIVKTKCYNIGNRYLPGNITTYKELKRLGPNTYLEYKDKKFTINRFYPIKSHREIKNKKEFDEKIEEIARIMHNNCLLATKKWKKPAISLSGGMDSKTTLAAANGLYDKFLLYSFESKEAEEKDANAAHKICEEIRQEHKIYKIPLNKDQIEDYEVMEKIINHNTAYMMNLPQNEIAKLIFLYRLKDFDIELKSWVSEVTRVTYERKYDIKFPEILNERQINVMNIRWFMHPFLMRKGDKIYRTFLQETDLNKKIYNYEHIDMCFWEIRCGSWETTAIQCFDMGNKTTIPYNNRKLLEDFLCFNHEDRKNGRVHKEIIKRCNHQIYNMNLTVINNIYHTYRITLEKIFFKIRTIFYRKKD